MSGGGAKDQALQCELCEHVECIKVCDRPSVELYTVLSVASSKAIMFTCTSCRRKGTLAWRLAEAEITLSGLHTQLSVYEQLLQERQQLVVCIASERDALQLENGELREQLCEACQAVSELRAKESVNSGENLTKPLSVSAPEFVSATLSHQPGQAVDTPWTAPTLSSGTRRKLPAVPTPVRLLQCCQLSIPVQPLLFLQCCPSYTPPQSHQLLQCCHQCQH